VSPTFFVDENDLALGRRLAERHRAVHYPGHPSLSDVPRGTPDDTWLRIVGTRRMIVITRDRRIRYRPVERLAWVQHAVRGFVLTGTKSQTTESSLAMIDRHWDDMLRIIDREPDGPWMRALTERGIRQIILE
jgi:hypothetical protein